MELAARKPVLWIGDSKERLREFPEAVRLEIGFAINQAELGEPHPSAKPMRGINAVEVVSDFDGTRQPLTLTPGTHHIEIDQNGFQPLAFDVTVQPGMVTPYQGELQPY